MLIKMSIFCKYFYLSTVLIHTSILYIKVEFLLHAHGRVGAFHYELVRVVEVYAESLRSVVVLPRRRVDEALVAL